MTPRQIFPVCCKAPRRQCHCPAKLALRECSIQTLARCSLFALGCTVTPDCPYRLDRIDPTHHPPYTLLEASMRSMAQLNSVNLVRKRLKAHDHQKTGCSPGTPRK